MLDPLAVFVHLVLIHAECLYHGKALPPASSFRSTRSVSNDNRDGRTKYIYQQLPQEE